MKPIDRLLQLLAARHAHFEWYGWQMSGYCSTLGSFVAFRAHPKGFEITIAFHDYRERKNGGFLPQRVFDRRGVPPLETHWIEVTIEDTRVRYGRKAVLPRTMFFPTEGDFKVLENIFEGIRKKSPIFTPNVADRLSSENAVLAMCDELS